MTDVTNFLEHYGVKGMRWGVRRAQKKAAQADKKWQKNIYSMRGAIEIHNNVAEKMNGGELDKLNSVPKYKNATRLLDDNGNPVGPTGKQYLKDYEKLTERLTSQAVAEVHGTSPSGGYKARFDTSTPEWKIVVDRAEVQHAAVVLPTLEFELNHDETGRITSARLVKEDLAQSSEDIGEFLQHYGVKGMRWGVRRRTRREEAARAGRRDLANRRRQLSDADLKKYVERLSTEKKLKDLVDQDLAPGRTVAKKIMSESGQKVAKTVITGAALFIIKTQLNNKFNADDKDIAKNKFKDLAGYVAPKPKNK